MPTAPCPYHRAFEVDRATGRAVTPACRREDADYDRKVFTVLPSPVVAWLESHDRAVPEGPVFADGCSPNSDAPPVLLDEGGHLLPI